MQAKLAWRKAVQFSATSGSGHALTIDGPPDHGGENAGPRPMELILMGTAGCTAYDVLSILRKARQEVTQCNLIAEATRADSVPAVFETIHLTFQLRGKQLDARKVERAIKLSAEKYCSASLMLQRAGVQVTHGFEIVEENGRGSP